MPQNNPINDRRIDFDSACNLDGWIGYLQNDQSRSSTEKFRRLYEKNMFTEPDHEPQHNGRIPKVIHQIWLGPQMPTKLRLQTEQWKQHHPDWQYRLWTDKDLTEFAPDVVRMMQSVDCYGQKGDILRIAILQRYGGLYIDVDYDCYRPCDILNESFDFYTTLRGLPLLHMQFPDVFPNPLDVCTSLIGSIPDHPILNEFLERIGDRLHNPEIIGKPSRLPFWGRINRMREAIRTTYHCYQQSFANYADQQGHKDIALPPTFLNPIDTWWKTRFYRPAYYKHLPKFVSCRQFKNKTYNLTHLHPNSFGHHDSHATWL